MYYKYAIYYKLLMTFRKTQYSGFKEKIVNLKNVYLQAHIFLSFASIWTHVLSKPSLGLKRTNLLWIIMVLVF